MFLTVTIVLVLLSLSNASAGTDDQTCKKQHEHFLRNVKPINFTNEFKFVHETKKSVLLSWSPGDKKTLVLVATNGTQSASDIYISENAGVTFELMSHKFSGKIFVSRTIGLQRNQFNANHVLLVCEENGKHVLWISKTGGKDWSKVEVTFIFKDPISFYEKRADWGLALSLTNTLYGTRDGGRSWRIIEKNVDKFTWSSHQDDPVGTIYLMRRTQTMGILSALFNIGVKKDLMKVDNFITRKCLRKDVWQFSAHGKFLYISERSKIHPLERYMKVSTDGGKTFEEVQLMSITPDRFYSIMDMSEGLIFMHVDSPGNTGHGTLYTSGADGILYSKSLERHLYPNFPSVSDFYRVLSMRGTYITTQMNSDNSMHTVISFNRGAEWRRLRKPLNADCKEGIADCGLQISSLYSKLNKVPTHVPLSSASAAGLILVHGHAHATLQTTSPDVYITSDGGYNWIKALDGPHKYQIADNGGLLIAVPENDHTVVKFSTDEGRCWHPYKFTNDDIIVTGLLTDPNNKIMKVVIWGYGKTDHIWRVYAIDFAKAVPRTCLSSDYEDWIPHAEMTHKDGDKWNGCLLGVKEVFKRLKKDSWCSNGEAYEVTKKHQPCPCTKDDYECEYGFSRPVNRYNCERNALIKELDSCIKGDLTKIMTAGYRKLPGNKCDKGFTPDRTKQVSLKRKCGKNDKGYEVVNGIHENINRKFGEKLQKTNHFDKSKIVWIVAGVCFVLIATVLVAVMISRYRLLRERTVNYKYSLLNTQNDEAFDAAMDVGLLDDQVIQPEPKKQDNIPDIDGKSNPMLRSYHDDSDVDMLE